MTEETLKKLEDEADLNMLEARTPKTCNFPDCIDRAVEGGLCATHARKPVTRERHPA